MTHTNIEQAIFSEKYLNKSAVAPRDFRFMRLMAMIYVTFLLAATVAAYKIVLIGPLPEPGSTLIYTFSFFLANVIVEIYGENISKKLLFESICCGYLFALLLTGINILPSPEYWSHANAFDQVIGHVFRFTNAGVIGYLASAGLNLYLFTKWKYMMHGRLFWIRSLLASSISEGAATFIAGFITFFGMIPSEKILLVMANALAFKILYGFVAVWPANFIAFILKKKEYPEVVNGLAWTELALPSVHLQVLKE